MHFSTLATAVLGVASVTNAGPLGDGPPNFYDGDHTAVGANPNSGSGQIGNANNGKGQNKIELPIKQADEML